MSDHEDVLREAMAGSNATKRVCRCSGGWDGADRGCVRWVPVSRRDEWCTNCGHDRACHTEGEKA